MKITIEISDTAIQALTLLGKSDAVSGDVKDVLEYVATSLADGVRRPGSWERQLLAPLFGCWSSDEPELRR